MPSPGTPEARSGWDAIRTEPDQIPGIAPENRVVEDITGTTLGAAHNIAAGEGPVPPPDRSGWDAFPNDPDSSGEGGGIPGGKFFD